MSYEVRLAGWGVTLGRTGRKQRVRREFCIMLRALKGVPSSFSTPVSATAEPLKKRKWSKLLRKPKPAVNTDSLIDAIVEFTKQKSKHWALVVRESDADSQGGKQLCPRLFEICQKPQPPELISTGKTDNRDYEWAHMPEDMSEDERDDVYDSDEGTPDANTIGSKMQMRASKSIDSTFEEPDHDQGGVFWDLLDRLRSHTKFTNAEIQNEAQRIWSRQRNYRVFNNNCHRFCILLAINLRVKQESTLRILTGEILKAQTTEGAFSAPVENPLPTRPR